MASPLKVIPAIAKRSELVTMREYVDLDYKEEIKYLQKI